MNRIFFFPGEWLNKPVKGFPTMHGIAFDQWIQRTVSGSKLPVIYKGIYIHRFDIVVFLPLTVNMPDFSNAKNPLTVSVLLFQHCNTGTCL